jgi:hypothetical protein
MFLITIVFRKSSGIEGGRFAKRTPKLFIFCQGKKKNRTRRRTDIIAMYLITNMAIVCRT